MKFLRYMVISPASHAAWRDLSSPWNLTFPGLVMKRALLQVMIYEAGPSFFIRETNFPRLPQKLDLRNVIREAWRALVCPRSMTFF